MKTVKVRILGTAITARYGTLSAGATLETDAEFAAHLVDDCTVAEYIDDKPVKPIKPKTDKLANLIKKGE
jgi:hypothetical protein